MAQANADDLHSRVEPAKASISLILPAWNEAAALPRAVREADGALQAAVSRYEIIVVDDGSQDGTSACLESLQREFPALRVLRHERNRGYGAALRTGFAAACCDLVAFTDADVQFDLREIDRFVLLAKDYDVVCGYRIDRQDAALRRFYSRGYNALVRTLVGSPVRDIDCAFKMFRRDKLAQLAISTDGFLVNTELLAEATQKEFSIVEVGVSHRPRREGQSTVSIRHIPQVLAALLRFWWNRVQFPGPPTTDVAVAPAATERSERRMLLGQGALLLVAAALLLTGLSYPLIDRDETRYAEIPREMVVSGDWLVPQLNFKTYYDKPPLLYWACAASYSLFGVSERSARLIPALVGVLTLAATMFFGNRWFNRRVGFWAGTALFLSVGFLGASRILLIDGLLSMCVACSLFAACEAVRQGKLQAGWWSVAGLALGLGCLAKGPVAIVLFLPPVGAYAWLTKTAYRPRPKHWLLLGAIAGAVAVPWFVAVAQRAPDFAYQFFYRHNLERFGGAFHAKPIWFFVPVVLLGGLPWTFLTLPCLSFVASRAREVRQQRTPQLGFAVLWAAWCLVFFSLSRGKLPTYVLPAAPALALVVGKFLAGLVTDPALSRRRSYATGVAPGLATATSCAAGAGFVAFGVWTGFEAPLQLVLTTAGVSAIGLAAFALRRQGRSPVVAWGACAAATLVVAAMVLHREIPRYAAARTLFGAGSPLREQLATAADVPVVTVGHEWSEVPFYSNRSDVANFDSLDGADLNAREGAGDRILLIAPRTSDGQNGEPDLPANVRVVSRAKRAGAQILLLERTRRSDLAARPAVPDAATR